MPLLNRCGVEGAVPVLPLLTGERPLLRQEVLAGELREYSSFNPLQVVLAILLGDPKRQRGALQTHCSMSSL
jgi:hypothetical protein